MIRRAVLAGSALHRCRRGTGTMELALMAPALVLLFAGMIDMSRAISGRLDLEQAALRTTDYALAVHPTSADGSYLGAEAAIAANVPANQVTVDIFLECNGVRAASFVTECDPGQTRARFVKVVIRRQVRAMFDWGSLSRLVGLNLMPDGIIVTGDNQVRIQ